MKILIWIITSLQCVGGSEIFTINNDTNGLTQIGLIASNYSNIDSIQIVSMVVMGP